MILDLCVPMNSVDSPRTYTIELEKGKKFPVLIIDRDSYIIGAKLQSSTTNNGGVFGVDGIFNLQIGKYCSLAESITFMINMNHDYLSVFQGSIREIVPLSEMGHNQKLRQKGQIIIQNDCWIGHGATIMSGVTIHNGAVVAANAHVVKDVPPYAIVGGNPAKIIKYRFSPEIIKDLLEIAWWDWPVEKLVENKDYLKGNIDEFINRFKSQ